MKDVLTLALLAVIVICLWAFSESLPFTSEVTVYLGFCPTEPKTACPKGEEAAGYTTYRAHMESQSVIYWSKNGPPSKYEHCAVRDAKNWSCRTTGLSGTNEHLLIDGEYAETVQIMGINLS